ncbi:MAG TPA: sulfotransferase family protein, partial [Ohtaekwangia sp.]|nr:sulfotransferase family protein [Ohtaekwangia sp.]
MNRINLISGPRNISTALMYSFAQRPDTIVMDEPFYAFYLAATDVDHPGKEAVLKRQHRNEKDVLREIFKPWPKPVLFIKNMSHHIELLREKFLTDVTNVFLIRNPAQIIASYAKVIANPVMRDIGIEYQYNLFEQLRLQGQNPVVIDSGRLLENPA